MSSIFLFLYTYYEFYFYLIVGFIGTGAAYLLLKKRNAQMLPVKISCVILVGSFFADSFFSILLKYLIRRFNESNRPYLSVILLKMFVSMMFGAIFVFVSILFFRMIKIIVNNGLVQRYKYGIIIFLITCLYLILHLPKELNEWCTVWYAVDYSMGIGSRFFIGSLLKFFHRGYLYAETVYHFYVSTLVLIVALISYLLNEIIVKSEDKHQRAVLFIVLCFIAGPGYISSMCNSENMGRLETYALLLSLVSIIVFNTVKNIYVRYLVITLFSCVSMAIYQGSLFMYYPLIVMLIVWDCLPAGAHSLKCRILGLINVVITSISFIFFQFFAYIKFESVEEVVSAVSLRSDIAIDFQSIDYEFFQPISAAYDSIMKDFLNSVPRERTLLTLVILSPLIILITALYLKCQEDRKKNREHIMGKPYFYFILSNFAIIPQFALNMDWGRWMISLYITIFFGILYLIYQKDRGMLKALDALSEFINTHSFASAILIVYLAGLSKFFGFSFIPEVNTLFSTLDKWL